MTEPYTPTTELMWEAYEYWAAGCGGSNRAEYERFLDAVRAEGAATALDGLDAWLTRLGEQHPRFAPGLDLMRAHLTRYRQETT